MDTTHLLGYVGALIVGLILGLIGGGGSILTVPLLVYLLGYNPVVATAYSLFVVGTTSIVGTYQKHKKGLVDFKIGLTFSFPSFLAVYLSRRYFVPNIPNVIVAFGDFVLTKETGIMVLFAIIMFLAAISMVIKSKGKGRIPQTQDHYKTFIQGVVIGTITGFIGAGGGFLYIPALVIWANLPMKKAVGTSLIIITINSLIGFIGDIQNLEIEWVFLLIFTFISMIGIVTGVFLSKFISGEKLKKSFGIFTLMMAIYIIYNEL